MMMRWSVEIVALIAVLTVAPIGVELDTDFGSD